MDPIFLLTSMLSFFGTLASVICCISYFISISIQSIRSEVVKNNKIEFISRWHYVLQFIRTCYSTFILYIMISLLCSGNQYVTRYLVHNMKHPGGDEGMVFRVMLLWWAGGLLDLVIGFLWNCIGVVDAVSFSVSTAERLVPLMSHIEQTVTVLIMNTPDCMLRIAISTCGNILSLVVPPKYTNTQIIWWMRLFACLAAIAHSMIITFSVEHVAHESIRSGKITLHVNEDQTATNYAIFQSTMAITSFIIWNMRQSKQKTD